MRQGVMQFWVALKLNHEGKGGIFRFDGGGNFFSPYSKTCPLSMENNESKI